MKTINQIFVTLLLLILSAKSASGQFEISGKVLDANSKFPVSCTAISLYPGESKTVTDDSGKLFF